MKTILNTLLLVAVSFVASISTLNAQSKPPGFLYVETSPPGALVFLNGDSIGHTTPFMKRLPAGHYRAAVELPGYKEQRIEFLIEQDEVTRQRVDFMGTRRKASPDRWMGEPDWEHGKLTVLSDRIVEVSLDDSLLAGRAPATYDGIPTGRHLVTIQHGAEQFTTAVEIQESEVARVEVVLDSNRADRGIQWPVAVVPVKLTIELPPCSYRVHQKATAPADRDRFVGVDGIVRIAGMEEPLSLRTIDFRTSRHDLPHPVQGLLSGGDTVIGKTFQVPVDSLVKFEFELYANPGDRFRRRDEVTRLLKRHKVPASFNKGREVNVFVQIQPDGDLIFRYW